MPNAGWERMPEAVKGFSQTHVSGTGGGQKYGNILIQPFRGIALKVNYPQHRRTETMSLGCYSCDYAEGPHTEITTSEKCAIYRFKNLDGLFVDAYSFLGIDTIPDKREAQQFVGCGININDEYEINGYSTVRGGWNNGGPYTVYFCLKSDVPFRKSILQDNKYAWLMFDNPTVNVKIGISFVSIDKARENIVDKGFDEQLACLRRTWEALLSKIKINASVPQSRMFYTALYHAMLMPVDRSGENPDWSACPYYDDYYAIWDTYRTSSPLITLLSPDRQRDIVNSLLNIYDNEGFMPDARSGNCNGRTQGGSNAEIVIADAFAKKLKGIDYQHALKAMIKDAEVAPVDAEKEGRGGIAEYNSLGYIPYGIDRAGNRTVEYSYDDWCIAQVAKGLGQYALYKKYMKRSRNWRNLWRGDYLWQGMRGFIMPRDADGNWLDAVVWGKSKVYHPLIPYAPDTKVAPWYVPWWGTFFYEALSAEYSLSIPHDVDGLIEACGGKTRFIKRLDTFFDNNHYNVANEPSFMTPYLYHWVDRPELSCERIRQIINDNYSDRPDGLPGNDDSGAMSSWLVWNMLGLYPVAGQNLYLVGSPLVNSYSIDLPDGKTLRACATEKNWNAKFITHEDILKGGTLCLPLHRGVAKSPKTKGEEENLSFNMSPNSATHLCKFILNRQYRNWIVKCDLTDKDTLRLVCNKSLYSIPKAVVASADGFCWFSPQKGCNEYHCDATFLFISFKALSELKRDGMFVYNGITWRKIVSDTSSITVKADVDNTVMKISTSAELPWVTEMCNNPLGIDWNMELNH
jgi:predicted alpha-1,2-mannosidase